MDKKVQVIILSLALIALTVSIATFAFYRQDKSTDNTALKTENDLLDRILNLEKNLEEITEENDIQNNKIVYLQNEIVRTNYLVKEQVEIINLKDNKDYTDENLILPIYTANTNTYEKEIKFYMAIPKNISMEEKLDIVANKVSQYCFGGLPIEVLEIIEIGDKRVAIVNLEESVLNKGVDSLDKIVGKAWIPHYFQGSCGGTITSNELVETFLQRDYNGEWIDGVHFLYESNTMDFDHVGNLYDINYR